MKNLICLFFALLFLISCASKNMNTEHQKEIAISTQRIGEDHYRNGRHTAALQNLLEAYKTIPDDPYLNNSLGLVYLAKKKYHLAENSFKKALKIKPDYIDANNNLGAAYLNQQKWNLAIPCFEVVSENLLYATPEMPLSNLGWVYFYQRIFRKAMFYFNKSLEIRPNFLNAVHGIASIYIETKYHTQAIDYLHHALEKNPGAAILHSDLAKAYEAIDDFDNARKSWDVVLKLEPETSSLAKEAQKRLFELN